VESLSPVLEVRDMDTTINYYRDTLKFTDASVLRSPDGSAVHGMASHGPVSVQFSPGGEPKSPRGAGVTLYVQVGAVDIDAYYGEVSRAGADVVETITDRFWGDRSFTVRDPDGYQIMFAKQVKNMTMEDMQNAMATA
jgi:PhnB protein